MALLLDQPAVVHRGDAVVRVSGGDRLAFLHTMTTQHLEHAAAGDVADLLYLDPKGNAVAAARAVVRTDDVLLLVPAPAVEGLMAGLTRLVFLSDVALAVVSGELAVYSVRGPAPVALDGAPADPMRASFDADGVLIRDRSGGLDLVAPPGSISARLSGSGWPEASAGEWETWRISAGQPAWGSEICQGRRPQELGLLPTHVHVRKGCYPGQESIAKMYNLGRPRRALAVIEVSGAVSPGDAVEVAGARGEVTSSAAVGAAWVALALLPLDREGAVPGDGAVSVGGLPGRVRRLVAEGLPQPGAGAPRRGPLHAGPGAARGA